MAAIGHLLAMGILAAAVAQLLIYKRIHPGAALVVGPVLICFPYTISRSLTGRLAGWLKGKGSKACATFYYSSPAWNYRCGFSGLRVAL